MRNKVLYGLFFLAVLLFIAKPFIGFATFTRSQNHITVRNILVKCFAKRKPEDLRDAETKKSALRALITNPPVKLLLSITCLLGILFPFAFRNALLFNAGYFNRARYSLIPVEHPNSLTGKLNI